MNRPKRTRWARLSALAIACSLSAEVAVAAQAHDLGEVLELAREHSKRATWTALDSDLLFVGDARIRGVESRFELFFSGHGQFQFQTEGQLANTTAWDGTTAWSRNAGAPSRALATDQRAASLFSQWTHNGYWCDERAPLSLALVSQTSDAVVLELSLEGAVETARLSLDSGTWLPALSWYTPRP